MHLWLIPEDIGVADAMIEARIGLDYGIGHPSCSGYARK
jgi:hypothetical protein